MPELGAADAGAGEDGQSDAARPDGDLAPIGDAQRGDAGGPDLEPEDLGPTPPDQGAEEPTDTDQPDASTEERDAGQDSARQDPDDIGDPDDEDGGLQLPACPAQAARLDLHANVHTMGVCLSFDGARARAELYYRAAGAPGWRRGHDLVRIRGARLAGSLFWLRPDQLYELQVIAEELLGCGELRTLPLQPEHQTLRTLHVAEAAQPGGDGSADRPFASIQSAINAAEPGTDILAGPGIYHESLWIEARGEPGRFIRILGDGAMLDGSDGDIAADGLPWTSEGGGVYHAAFHGRPTYLARDRERMYHYPNLQGLRDGRGHRGVAMAEGWFATGDRLYVRCLDPPVEHIWQVPVLGTAFALSGAAWIWIEGFEIGYYGEGEYPKGVDLRGSDHIVVRHNEIHDMPTPVWIRRGTSFTRIEHNLIYQSAVHLWPWDAVKGTDHENSAILVEGGAGTIIAYNEIREVFNGVYTGSFGAQQDPDLAFDVDAYENRLSLISDDGFEPEGACINQRFWHNVVDQVHNGISLAPVTFGPTWVVRNRFSNYDESGFKVSNGSSGPVFLYHNTCWTDRPDQNGMNISGTFENMVFRNNIVRGTRYALEMSMGARPNDLDHDNLFTTRGPPVVKWDNVRYDDLAALCRATGLECHGQPEAPGLIDPAQDRFGLAAGSPNIDSGLRIPGINDDFEGEAPDIGHVELGQDEPPFPPR